MDTGPNAAKERVRENMAPLNHETQTPTSPQGIPHRLSTPRVDSYNMYNCNMPRDTLDAAAVARRRHRVTSFAFPSGGAPAGASLHLRLPLRRRRPRRRVRRLHLRHRLRRLRPALPASTAHLRRDVQLGFRRRLQRLQPRLGVPPGRARQVDRSPYFDRTIVTCGKETLYVHVPYMTETRELR